MVSPGMAAVGAYTEAIRDLLRIAQDVKLTASIDPALTVSDFDGGIEKISQLGGGVNESNQRYYAAIETAFRNVFHHLLAATTIENPAFGQIWNLLDIVTILSDSEQCEPGLVFWLVEELLDSQTIDGCKTVFDYLDSRRERLNAKHFKQKQLIILRACNELLRRLSRAEDTVFCGRVFIFLFQSFPLGDRSSVNLRGEYHVENVTMFDKTPVVAKQDGENMDTDPADDGTHQPLSTEVAAVPLEGESSANGVFQQTDTGSKSVKPDLKAEQQSGSVLDMDALYPIFWTLQESFSMPTRLFEPNHFQSFRKGLESTISKFKAVHQDLEARGTSKLLDDNKRGIKRKRTGHGDDLSNSFNPRYLTSRDLFELEVSDLTFRRHILVQALILVDFLLSLTPKAKKKLDSTTNKSVLYSYTLSEENTTWATRTRSDIAAYLQQGAEGKFYYRMVDTVLSRDKNWVRWKAENCPPIEHAPVSAEEFALAKNGSHKAYTNKRMRATPMGSLDLRFLVDVDGSNEIDKLKDPQRYSIPTAESFRGAIADDDFDIEMAKTDEEKQQAINARASKLWRTLRIASKNKLSLFDKIDDGNNLNALFEPQEDDNSLKVIDSGTDQSAKDTMPLDNTTVNREAPVETASLREVAVI